MKKDYSVDEMKKIMGQDMEVPKSVDEGMKKAYEQLGIQTTRRHNRKYKLWTGLAAAAVLTAGAFHHGVCGDKISQCNAK